MELDLFLCPSFLVLSLSPSTKAWLSLLYILPLGSNKISHSLSLCSAFFLRLACHVLQPPRHLGGPLLSSLCYVSGFPVMGNSKTVLHSQGQEVKRKAFACITQCAVGFFAVRADCWFTFSSAHQGLPGSVMLHPNQSVLASATVWALQHLL